MIAAPARAGSWIGPGIAGAVRVALGILWLLEGITKYRAGFGGADIGLVVQSAAGNSRVPWFFAWFAQNVMSPLQDAFGILMPALETALGLLLIAGLVTVPAALVSVGTLLLYWSADQLIAQYPIMVALSVLVVLFPRASTRYSADRLLTRRRTRPGEPVRE